LVATEEPLPFIGTTAHSTPQPICYMRDYTRARSFTPEISRVGIVTAKIAVVVILVLVLVLVGLVLVVLVLVLDTRALQAYLGHRNINTTRYTALVPDRFKGFWRD
jgi:hypothetical protein